MKLTKIQLRKKKQGLCITPFCQNEAKRGNYCYKCEKNKENIKYPIKRVYYNLRTNAKRRGKSFDLTIEEFTKFVKNNNYMELKGRNAVSATIDRIRNDEGYHIDNMTVISLKDNAIKGSGEFEVNPKECPF